MERMQFWGLNVRSRKFLRAHHLGGDQLKIYLFLEAFLKLTIETESETQGGKRVEQFHG